MKLEINPLELSNIQREIIAEFILKFNESPVKSEIEHLAEEQEKDLKPARKARKKTEEIVEETPSDVYSASGIIEVGVEDDPNVVFNTVVEINPKTIFAEIISKCTKAVSTGKVKQEDISKTLSENDLPPLPVLSTLFSEPDKLQKALGLINGLLGE